MRYAEQAGLSPEVLAQLFPVTDQALVDPSVEGRSLADAVATAIAAWLATNQAQSAATGEASSLVPGSVGRSQISSDIDPARFLEVDVESLNQLIAPILAQVTAEGDAEGSAVGAAPSVDLAMQITAGLQAVISSQSGADQLKEDTGLLTHIRRWSPLQWRSGLLAAESTSWLKVKHPTLRALLKRCLTELLS